jgi:hypothetical protein
MARQQAQRPPENSSSGHPEHHTPRAYLVTDDDVTDAVARYVPARPQLDTISRLALAEGPPAPQPLAEPSPDRYAAAADDAEPPGEGQEDPEAILRRALSAASAEGIPVSDLITVTGMSRRWVFYRLRQLAADGYAVQTVRGHWRTVR